MKAIVFTQYGSPDVLQFRDMADPAPADREVLVRVCAASVNPLDFHQMRGHVRFMTGMRTPKQQVLGCDIAGRVEEVGRQVKQFRPGALVFGVRGIPP